MPLSAFKMSVALILLCVSVTFAELYHVIEYSIFQFGDSLRGGCAAPVRDYSFVTKIFEIIAQFALGLPVVFIALWAAFSRTEKGAAVYLVVLRDVSNLFSICWPLVTIIAWKLPNWNTCSLV